MVHIWDNVLTDRQENYIFFHACYVLIISTRNSRSFSTCTSRNPERGNNTYNLSMLIAGYWVRDGVRICVR